MIDNLIAVLCRNLLLALLDDLIDELNNFASLSANHVVVMIITDEKLIFICTTPTVQKILS